MLRLKEVLVGTEVLEELLAIAELHRPEVKPARSEAHSKGWLTFWRRSDPK
jgi:hypothetical protein